VTEEQQQILTTQVLKFKELLSQLSIIADDKSVCHDDDLAVMIANIVVCY
jgi:hypothetical protein